MDELWASIERHRAHLDAAGALAEKRRARLLQEVESLAAERVREAVAHDLAADGALAARLLAREVDPYAAADELIRRPASP